MVLTRPPMVTIIPLISSFPSLFSFFLGVVPSSPTIIDITVIFLFNFFSSLVVTYPWYTDVWNRPKESEIQLFTTSSFRYETFITFWVKGFSRWGRERETIFLCWLLLHHQLSTQPTHGARNAQSRLASPSSESQLSSSEAGTQLTAFSQISDHASGAWRHPSTLVQSLSGIFILTSLNNASSLHAREHLR